MAFPYKRKEQIPSGKAGIFDRCARNYSTFRECYPLLPFPALPFAPLFCSSLFSGFPLFLWQVLCHSLGDCAGAEGRLKLAPTQSVMAE